MSDKKAWKKLRKQLEAQGCVYVPTKNNAHFKVYRDGEIITVTQTSHSCPRAYQNKLHELRRKGIDLL